MAEKVDLIVSALREQISNLSLENAIFRAEITLLTDERTEFLKEKAELEAAVSKGLEEKCNHETQS